MAASGIVSCDVAIVICSRGREACLTRLLGDLRDSYAPALLAGGLTSTVWVYAQNYPAPYLARLNETFAAMIGAGALTVIEARRTHRRIGEVALAAFAAVQARCAYRLAMLMDDDSVYAPDPQVDLNLRRAARRFVDEGHRAYSIKLGTADVLSFGPFVTPPAAIMPFKEKMLWVSREVLDEILALPRFAELSIGEDAVIAAMAWLGGPHSCFAVHGLASFLHLGFEGGETVEGGYADLVGHSDPGSPNGKYEEALRRGVTPHHVLPDVFVPDTHPHYEYNGIREEAIAAMLGAPPGRGA